jgi:hypothetical protein
MALKHHESKRAEEARAGRKGAKAEPEAAKRKGGEHRALEEKAEAKHKGPGVHHHHHHHHG